MQELFDQHPAAFFSVMFPTMWLTIGFLIARIGGWGLLAEKYRTDREFPRRKRWMQSAQMRFGTNYNSVLTLASDSEGIYMRVMSLFRMGHPPLFIPWAEIQVDEPRRWLLWKRVALQLGTEAVPLRLYERTAKFLLEPRGGMDAVGNAAATGTISSSF